MLIQSAKTSIYFVCTFCACIYFLFGTAFGEDINQYNMALTYYEKGQYVDAKQHFMKYLGSKPSKDSKTFIHSLYCLGVICESQYSYEEALGFFELYVKISKPKDNQVIAKIEHLKEIKRQNDEETQRFHSQIQSAIDRQKEIKKQEEEELRKMKEQWDKSKNERYSNVPGPAGKTASPMQANELYKICKSAVVVVLTERGQGSGAIISKTGIVISNYHVIENADNIKVQLHSKNTYQAAIIAVDPYIDLALLKIQEDNLPHLRFEPHAYADSNIGNKVFVIGAPKGLTYTITEGIISQIRDTGKIKYIQTNAQINPGNSGGPLLDEYGRIVGIITWKYAQAEGLGFAVSSTTVLEWMRNL
jgi:S1-C subfamily serine protease